MKKIEGYIFDKSENYTTSFFDKEEGMYMPNSIGVTEIDYRPMICKCGSKMFEVFFPEHYHTAVKCMQCGNQHSVHQG